MKHLGIVIIACTSLVTAVPTINPRSVVDDVIKEACVKLDRGSDGDCLAKSNECLSTGNARGFDSLGQCLRVELGLEELSPEQKEKQKEKKEQEQQKQQQEQQERQKGEGRQCYFIDNDCGDGLKCRPDPFVSDSMFPGGTCEPEDEQQWQQKVKGQEKQKKIEQKESNVRGHECQVSLSNCAQGLECVANHDPNKSPVLLPSSFWDEGTCQPKGAQQQQQQNEGKGEGDKL